MKWNSDEQLWLELQKTRFEYGFEEMRHVIEQNIKTKHNLTGIVLTRELVESLISSRPDPCPPMELDGDGWLELYRKPMEGWIYYETEKYPGAMRGVHILLSNAGKVHYGSW